MCTQDKPGEDATTYDMICKGSAVEVLQIKSRAKMAILPHQLRHKFSDLVIKLAVARPGPFWGHGTSAP